MNKYETLFDEIVNQTRSKSLNWKQVRRHENAELIFNPNLVFRQFSADFPRNGAEFKLLFIEKKYDDPEDDFGYARYAPEVLVVDHDGDLVTTLTDSVIERADMLRLADMIEANTGKVSKLFGTGG